MNFSNKIWVLDGAMGSMIPRHCHQDFTSFYPDLYTLADPASICMIHSEYINAGADIITTNTLSANALSLTSIGLRDKVDTLNKKAVALARKAIEHSDNPNVKVAGSIGPTSLSLTTESESANYQKYKQELQSAFSEQTQILCDEGVDILLIETAFDLDNARCALISSFETVNRCNRHIDVMLSVCLNKDGLTPMRQNRLDIKSLASEFPIAALGINCCSIDDNIEEWLIDFCRLPLPLMIYPNAGTPDANGIYPYTPQVAASIVEGLMAKELVNIVGGCCGTTPKYIETIASMTKQYKPRNFR